MPGVEPLSRVCPRLATRSSGRDGRGSSAAYVLAYGPARPKIFVEAFRPAVCFRAR